MDNWIPRGPPKGMIIVSHYTKEWDSNHHFFWWQGRETIHCPYCQGELKPYDRRKRVLLDHNGKRWVFSLRRLRCQKCKRMHIELPDMIVWVIIKSCVRPNENRWRFSGEVSREYHLISKRRIRHEERKYQYPQPKKIIPFHPSSSFLWE